MLPTGSDSPGFDAHRRASESKARSPAAKGRKSALAVVGTEFGCGKTVLLTGLVAMLKSYGFSARAVKPIVTGKRDQVEAELSFISSITQTNVSASPVVLDPSVGLSSADWNKVVAAGQYFLDLTLVELPGSSTTPLSFDYNAKNTKVVNWKDSADLALSFSCGALLVARHDLSALEKLAVHSGYLINKGLKVLGLATVETVEEGGNQLEKLLGRDAFELLLLARTSVPYLGCIKFSPSVSVPRVSQGNLIKLTATGLELLEMLKALNLPLPTSP